MVAKINFPKRVEAALNYNEKKVVQGKAVCLAATAYFREGSDMNFYQKLEGLQRLNMLNDRANTKTIHVSLNFDPSEKLPANKLLEIATAYMARIGFDGQPCLIYQHHDAGHPHIHIVSTTIHPDGSRIPTHNIGRNASEKARKELEQLYGLVQAEKQKKSVTPKATAINIEKAVYGKDETKAAIASVISSVFIQYKFASLPEYNAILRQFNVTVSRGKEGGRTHTKGGLMYRLLDSNGYETGVPIKASLLPLQPTLKKLEEKFTAHAGAKDSLKGAVKAKLDRCLAQSQTIPQFTTALTAQQVFTLLRKSVEGNMYGITYVDNEIKIVVNGSDLGKEYGAAAIQKRFAIMPGEEAQKLYDEQKANIATSTRQRQNDRCKNQCLRM